MQINSHQLTLPAFFVDQIGDSSIYVGVLNESTYIRMHDFGSCNSIASCDPRREIYQAEIAIAIEKYVSISEEDFFAAWKRLYNDMDLMPKEVINP